MRGAWQRDQGYGGLVCLLVTLVSPAGSSAPRSTLVPDPQPLTGRAQALFGKLQLAKTGGGEFLVNEFITRQRRRELSKTLES